MSRKSRQHAADACRKTRGLLVSAFAVLLAGILCGTFLLTAGQRMRPIYRGDALAIEDTFREATLLRRPRRRSVRSEEYALRLTFATHGDMTIPYGWRGLEWDSTLPDGWQLIHAQPDEEPIRLASLPEGTHCHLLTDPNAPDEIWHLETDGGVLVDFDDSVAVIQSIGQRRFGLALVCCGAGVTGAAALCIQYVRRKRKKSLKTGRSMPKSL